MYQNQTDLDAFLGKPGSENVSDQFASVIAFGFYSQTILFTFCVLKSILSGETGDKYGVSMVLFTISVRIMQLTQISLLAIYRFSHSGAVCSGDYVSYFLTNDGSNTIDRASDPYLMKSEGSFFRIYLMIWIVLLCVLLCLSSIVPCIGLTHAATTVSNIEEFFWKMGSFTEEMKKAQERSRNPNADGSAPGQNAASDAPNGANVPDPRAANMEDFKNDFKMD
jgi:hypothetical protein